MVLNPRLTLILILFLLLFILFLSPVAAGIPSEAALFTQEPSLERELVPGEAAVWYLGHCGWAVRTKNFFLIFDYTQYQKTPENPSIVKGDIVPGEIKDQNVFVFVSHGHRDHFDEAILDWEEHLDRIRYIFGWKADDGPNSLNLVEDREGISFNGLEVQTINHDFDGIPEAAFLVKVDGLVIYFAGDHGSTGDVLNPSFKDNIDYLSSRVDATDLAFIPQFGASEGGEVNRGDLYTIEKLKPRLTCPMHQGGGERFYQKFAREASEKGAQTKFFAAEKMGDGFVYQDGKIK